MQVNVFLLQPGNDSPSTLLVLPDDAPQMVIPRTTVEGAASPEDAVRRALSIQVVRSDLIRMLGKPANAHCHPITPLPRFGKLRFSTSPKMRPRPFRQGR